MRSDFFPAPASSRIASRSVVNTAMGAENSKPSSEVKQHVFSTYVPLSRANGTSRCNYDDANKFARRDHPVRFSNELVDSLQKNTFVSLTCQDIWVEADGGIDRFHPVETARTPIPGTPDRRTREVTRARDTKLLQIQRDPLRRV